MFARGSAYVPFPLLLLLLLLLRQVSVAPLLAVTVVVTLLIWLMNCGSVFQYLQYNGKIFSMSLDPEVSHGQGICSQRRIHTTAAAYVM